MAAPFEGATARALVAVTASDTTNLSSIADALYVGTGGDVVVLAKNDTAAVTLKNVASGTVLPISTRRVNSTNTTATDIVALYY